MVKIVIRNVEIMLAGIHRKVVVAILNFTYISNNVMKDKHIPEGIYS